MAKKHKALNWLLQRWHYLRSHPYLWGLLALVIVHLPNTAAAWLTVANLWMPQVHLQCPAEVARKIPPPTNSTPSP